MSEQSNKPILIVEDNLDQILLIERAFRKLKMLGPSFALQVVYNGLEGISYLEGKDRFANRDSYPWPVLVITNVRMPHMSGPELVAWMRARSTFANLPVVMLSSSAREEDRQAALDLGANGYLIKPLLVDTLYTQLQILRLL